MIPSCSDPALAALHTAALERRQQAVRPGTRKNLRACQTLFLQFCLQYGVDVESPTVDEVGALVELLLESWRSVPTVKNYCTAIKSLYVQWNNQNVVSTFESPTWRMMLRGITLSIGPSADRRTAVELEDLKAMIGVCNTDVSLLPLKVALLLGYSGYLRISNLAPPTMDQFDATRHTSWADVTPSKHGIMIALKWTKSLQAQKGTTPVPIPALKGSPLCPLQAWEEYTNALPGIEPTPNTPLLLTTSPIPGRIISVSVLRAMFSRTAGEAGLESKGYTPHSLRRGGATYSFTKGVPLQFIKQHGTWKSSAVEDYLIKTPLFTTPVAQTFINTLTNQYT